MTQPIRPDYLPTASQLLTAIPSKNHIVSLQEPQVLYYLMQLNLDTIAHIPPKPRQALHCLVLLDVSRSMRGFNSERALEILRALHKQLHIQDTLTIFPYSDELAEITPILANESNLQAELSKIELAGGTDISHGLRAITDYIQRHPQTDPFHAILMSDGNTYDDHEHCLELTRQLTEDGCRVSTFGIGNNQNTRFLEAIAKISGQYWADEETQDIAALWLQNQIYTSQIEMVIETRDEVTLENVTKILPEIAHIEFADPTSIIIKEESLDTAMVSILFQFTLPGHLVVGTLEVGEVGVQINELAEVVQESASLSIAIVEEPTTENPPSAILDALGKLTLHRMQQKAEQAMEQDMFKVNSMDNLAARFDKMGEHHFAKRLAEHARNENIPKSRLRTRMLVELS